MQLRAAVRVQGHEQLLEVDRHARRVVPPAGCRVEADEVDEPAIEGLGEADYPSSVRDRCRVVRRAMDSAILSRPRVQEGVLVRGAVEAPLGADRDARVDHDRLASPAPPLDRGRQCSPLRRLDVP